MLNKDISRENLLKIVTKLPSSLQKDFQNKMEEVSNVKQSSEKVQEAFDTFILNTEA